MSSLAFWSQRGYLEEMAKKLHLEGRADVPQMREKKAPG